MINKLFVLVKESTDPLTVAVALFDLGEFARNYPNSKIFFDRHDSKEEGVSNWKGRKR